HRAAAEHDDPVDHLLAGVEAVGERVRVADDAAALLQPFDVDAVGNVPGDPHQEDQHHAEREREADVVMGVFRPLRPGGERLRAQPGQQQLLAEGDVKAGQRQNDEAARGHPVHEPFERIEAHDVAAGAPGFDADHAAHQVEDDQQYQHSHNGNAADPVDGRFLEMPPVTAG